MTGAQLYSVSAAPTPSRLFPETVFASQRAGLDTLMKEAPRATLASSLIHSA